MTDWEDLEGGVGGASDVPPAAGSAGADMGGASLLGAALGGGPNGEIAAGLATTVLSSTSTRAQTLIRDYGDINKISPSFDVEPEDVLRRLANSFSPLASATPTPETSDLYGPLMLSLTLGAILLLGMKLEQYSLSEGTLMGSALGTAFTYWALSSLLFYSLSYVFDANITLIEVSSATGYALSGFCAALLVGCFFSPLAFYVAYVVCGGLASARLGLFFFRRTPNRKHGLMVGGTAAGVHAVFLLYLRYFYVNIAAAVDDFVVDVENAVGGE